MNEYEIIRRMKKNGDTQASLARELHISTNSLNAKLHNRETSFTLPEIALIVKKYDLSGQEIFDIFFKE